MGICEVRQITCCFLSIIHTVSHEIAKHIRYDNWCLGVFAVLLPLKCMAQRRKPLDPQSGVVLNVSGRCVGVMSETGTYTKEFIFSRFYPKC